VDASKKSLTKRVAAGQSFVLYPGGIAELFLSSSTEEVIFCRKGFIKLALTTGADVIPIYLFGNTTVLQVTGNTTVGWYRTRAFFFFRTGPRSNMCLPRAGRSVDSRTSFAHTHAPHDGGWRAARLPCRCLRRRPHASPCALRCLFQVFKHPALVKLSRSLGASLTLFWGRWGLPLPLGDPLIYARAKPLGMPKIENPTDAQVRAR
jgi:hypothetical protein